MSASRRSRLVSSFEATSSISMCGWRRCSAPRSGGSSQVAEQFFPENEVKQDAFDKMTNEINTGWNNAGLQGMAIGSNVGMAIGCVSIFPNFIAGCIVGAVVGTIAGAVIGIGVGNPNAQPAVEQFFATP